MKFADLGLGPEVLRAVEDAGYTEPTPIQEQAIPIVLMGRDVLGSAQTGTGKTAGFTLPMIEILAAGRAKARMPRSLIIEPTRELAAQVQKSFATYGKYHRLTTALLIGGTSFGDQERALDRGVDVLIATPGRLIDLFERGKIVLADVKILVIDEADRMLDMGFIPDVERIVGLLPKIRQTLFFSATMPPEIRKLADKFLMNPKEISVSPPASPAETVEHVVAEVAPRDKPRALLELIESLGVDSALVFCNRKKDIGAVVQALKRKGLNATELHGDMPQSKRTETLDAFKRDEIAFVVASDVAARGLDITQLPHVINYDVPMDAEAYVHRIGRTGRAGRKGDAITLATRADKKYLDAIEELIGKPIRRIPVPGAAPAPKAEKEERESRPARRRGGRGRAREREKAGEGRKGRRETRRGAKPKAERPPAEKRPAEARRDEKAPPKAAGGKGGRGKATRAKAARGKAARGKDEGSKGAPGGLGNQVPAFLLRPVPTKPGDSNDKD